MPVPKFTLPIAAVAALAAFPAAAQVAYNFDALQFPGASTALPLGINDSGQIAGELANDPALPPLVLNGQDFWTTGFEFDNGVYSLIYYPAVQVTPSNPGWPTGSATGISSTGVVVGTYATTATNALGYTESGGSYTALGFAPAPDNFTPTGINNAGVTAGTCGNCAAGESSSAYIDDAGSITILNAPNDGGATTAAGDINDNGYLIVQTAAGTSYRYGGGAYTQILVPDSLQTLATSINNDGLIAGSYQDQTGQWHGFVEDDGNNFATIDDPLGSGGTYLTGINDSGQLIGSYIDANGLSTGFEANTVREPASIALLRFSLIGLGLLRRHPAGAGWFSRRR